MRLLEPGFLILALAALLPWVGPLATRDRRHALLRSAALLLVVFALARPVREVMDTASHRAVVLDRSASVTDAADAAAVRWLRGALEAEGAAAARWTVVEVGARDALELPRGVAHVALPADGASALGAALDAAARAVPPGAQSAGVALLTDGLATGDPLGADAAPALADLAARGVPVDVLALDGAPGDLRALDLRPVAPARAGREVTLVARLVGGGQVVTCRLEGPGGEVARVDDVRVDGEARVALAYVPEDAGFEELVLTVEVTDGVDPRAGDLRLARTLCVDDPLRVRYLGQRMQGGGERLAELLGGGFEVDAQGGAGFEGADVVFLDDRPASAFSAADQAVLAERVKDGTLGLVAAGGEAAFGPGGYHEEPIEELLPVEFVQKEEKRDPSTTLVVIIDTSGSMGGNRVQLAKEVSRLAIRRLLPHDKVGMVEFYGAKRWAVPIQPASNSIEIERALNRLDAGGGTVILPAIEEAYYGLKNVRTRFKHVLILTDGGVETGAFEPLLRRMADDGMNVSTVLIGPDAHSEFLVNIANWGQGRFYSVPNRFNLPEILLKQPASAKLPAYRPGLVNVRARGGPAWWGDVDPASVPPLAGYVETRARPGAERVLETADEGHPVLASWQYGLGRVTALLTEPTGPGTEPWADWDGFGALLGRAVERSAADERGPFTFELVREPGGARLVAEARAPAAAVRPDGPRPSARRVGARVGGATEAAQDPSQDPSQVPPQAPPQAPAATQRLERVAPDRWELRFPLAPDEALRLECGERVGAGLREPAVRLALDPLAGGARELQVEPGALDALGAAVAATGGALRAFVDVAPGATAVAERRGAAARPRLRELAPLLALLALLTYLADVAYRRWPRQTAP